MLLRANWTETCNCGVCGDNDIRIYFKYSKEWKLFVGQVYCRNCGNCTYVYRDVSALKLLKKVIKTWNNENFTF